MTQPIIVDQTKSRQVQEALDFLAKFRDFDFSTMPEEEFLETVKVFERHRETLTNALKGLTAAIDEEVLGQDGGNGDTSGIVNPAGSESQIE